MLNTDIQETTIQDSITKSRQNWHKVRFGDVVCNVDISEHDPLTNGIDRSIGLEHIDPESLHITRWGNIEDGTSFTRKFIAGQVLFGKRRAYQGKVALAEFDGICSGDILVFEAKDDLIPDLLPFIVQSEGFYKHALNTSAGSLSPRTKWKDLAAYEFALPPKDEQRRIAEILWAIDKASHEFNNCISAQKRMKETLLEELFILDDSTPRVTFGSVGNWMSGGTPSRIEKEFWDGNIPWASPKDMKVDLLIDTQEHVSEKGVKSGSRIIPTESILIVIRGMILAHTFPIAITGIPMAFNQDMKALVVSQDFNSKFIFYWLQSRSKEILRLVSDSSHGTKRISTEQLFELSTPHVSHKIQDDTVKALEECDSTMQYFQDHCKRLTQLKNKLLQVLL